MKILGEDGLNELVTKIGALGGGSSSSLAFTVTTGDGYGTGDMFMEATTVTFTFSGYNSTDFVLILAIGMSYYELLVAGVTLGYYPVKSLGRNGSVSSGLSTMTGSIGSSIQLMHSDMARYVVIHPSNITVSYAYA